MIDENIVKFSGILITIPENTNFLPENSKFLQKAVKGRFFSLSIMEAT